MGEAMMGEQEEVTIGLRHQLEITKESCFATDQTNLDKYESQIDKGQFHSSPEWIQRIMWDLILLRNTNQDKLKRNVSYFFSDSLSVDPDSILIKHKKYL